MSHQRLRGLGALLRLKRPTLIQVPLVVGAAVLGVVLGQRLGILPEGDRGSLIVLLGVLGFFAPFLFAEETCGPAPEGRSLREAHLAGPLGDWTLPAYVHLGSLALLAGVAIALSPALALAGLPSAKTALVGVALGAYAWAWSSSAVAIGSSTAVGLPFLIVLPAAWAAAPISTGYSDGPPLLVYLWCGGILALFWLLLLGLPYLLYARPRHYWEATFSADTNLATGLPPCLAVLGLMALPYFGWIPAALLGLPWVVRRLRRRQPVATRRALRSHLSLGVALLLGICAPIFAGGLLADAWLVAACARHEPGAPTYGYSAPEGGRRLAALSNAHRRGPHQANATPRSLLPHRGDALARAAVLDASGRVEHVFAPRFAGFSPYAWSQDGRYVAVFDLTLGRVPIGEPERPADLPPGYLLGRIERVLEQQVFSTLVYDTQKRSVQRLPLVELRPGWSDPRQLLQHSLTLSGQHLLRDGRDHELSSRASYRVERYTAEGAVLRRGVERWLLRGETLEPLPRAEAPAAAEAATAPVGSAAAADPAPR